MFTASNPKAMSWLIALGAIVVVFGLIGPVASVQATVTEPEAAAAITGEALPGTTDVTVAPGLSGSPDLDVSSDGQFISLVYFKRGGPTGQIYIKSSTSGVGWLTAPNPLGTTRNGPKVAFSQTSNTRVYVVWEQDNTQIQLATCTLAQDAPPACGEPQLIRQVATADLVQEPNLVVANVNGTDVVHIAWVETLNETNTKSLQKTTVGGNTTVRTVATTLGEFKSPVLAVSNNQVHLAALEDPIAAPPVQYTAVRYYSSDSNPTDGIDGTNPVGLRQSFVAGSGTEVNSDAVSNFDTVDLAASGTNIYLMWDGRIPGTSKYALIRAVSTDAGTTWPPTQTRFATSDSLPATNNAVSGGDQRTTLTVGTPAEEAALRPSIAVRGSGYAVAWHHRPADICDNSTPERSISIEQTVGNSTSEVHYTGTSAPTTFGFDTVQSSGNVNTYSVDPVLAIDPTNPSNVHMVFMRDQAISTNCLDQTDSYELIYRGPFVKTDSDEGESPGTFYLPALFK